MIINKSNFHKYYRQDNNSFNCSNSDVTEIKFLPPNVTMILCYQTKLKELPALPEGLDSLFCDDGLINVNTIIPTTLEYLDCERLFFNHESIKRYMDRLVMKEKLNEFLD